MAATDSLSATLFALADPTRRGILAHLAKGDATVKALAEPYDMSVAAVSKHLKVLETAGLVARSKEAQWRPCHLQAAPLRAVSLWLGDYARFWEDSMDALDDHLRAMQRRTKAKRAKRAKRAKKTARKRLVATR